MKKLLFSFLLLFSFITNLYSAELDLPFGVKYSGEVKNGLPHGKGVSIEKLHRYIGGWNQGKYDGEGIVIYIDGSIFKAEWKDGSYVKEVKTFEDEFILRTLAKEKLVKEKQDAKLMEENNNKKLVVQKQKIEEDKTDKLLASMRPDERRAYICEKTYGFKKGSDRFADCVFKIMTTDAELEKLDKQRRIVEAQLKAEKEKAPVYDPAIGRAVEKAVEIEAARLRREQEEENARLMFALSKGLGTPGGFNSKVQGTVDSLNPNQNRRTKRVCNSLRTASGYQTVCKDVPY